MTGRIRYLAPLIGLWLVPPMFAADSDQVKCGPNQDRVWVYDSLNSFDIETRLKCGDSVDIISRVRGYVEIRTASGMEGYVPDTAFPDLPPLPPDDNDKPLASVIPRRKSSTSELASSTPPASPVAPVPVASLTTVPKPIPAAMTAAAVPAVSVVASAPRAPAVASIAPVAAVSTSHPSPVTNVNSPVAVVTTMKIEPEIASAPQPPPVVTIAPAVAAVSASQPSPGANVSAPVAPAVSVKVEPDIKAAPRSQPAPTPIPSSAVTAPSVPAVPPKEFASTISVSMKEESDAIATPSRDIVTEATAKVVPESEDYPDTQAQNESGDPACRIFFSAYGLTPSQYKWLADNRRKQFAEVCPAPDPGRVDYVVLFTHDSDVYADAMPTAIHTDRNGFSDFSPMTAVDTALVSPSDADRARYEFVWVFRMQRGNFDPAKFSPRRRPQFNTEAKGSHASARTLEDAFHFMETQDPNR